MQGLLSQSRILNSSIFGAGGSNIKSIQRGTVLFSATSTAVAITAVDINKSIVIMQVYSAGANSTQIALVGATLTNATTITFEKNLAGNVDVSWQVVEFNNVKSKQYGSKATAAASDTVAITGIDTAKSVLVVTYFTAVNTASIRDCFNYAVLTNSTTITFTTYNTSANTTYKWQVLEFS